jgi:hypothetical protein
MTKNPMDTMFDWMRVASAYHKMSLAAAEVIAHRTMMMASGAMTGPEAMGMVMEKATVFATSTERAAMAAAGGAEPARIASAALRPYSTKTRANARKMRR